MALTKRSKVKELSKLPEALDLIEKHTGKKVSSALLKMGQNMTLQVAAAQMGWPEDKVDTMLEEANRILATRGQ